MKYIDINTNGTYPCCDACTDFCLKLLLVSDEEQDTVSELKSTHEEARTSSLVGDTRPLEFKPTTDERNSHLREAITNPETVTRSNMIDIRRH